jgi:predicted metal-dependent phosphotriesterase family hydrolase
MRVFKNLTNLKERGVREFQIKRFCKKNEKKSSQKL